MDRFTAIADPTRRQILDLLANNALRASDVAAHFDASAPAISQHLKVLRETGLVGVERRGRERIYRIDSEGLAAIESWAAQTRRRWNAHLDALENILNEED